MNNPLQDSLAKHLTDAGWVVAREMPLGSVVMAGQTPRADVYALKKSYHGRALIYEVKRTRGDFNNDVNNGKYETYFPHCHQLFFAVPAGLVKKEEVPEGTGLITFTKGKGWYVVSSPRVRHIEVPRNTLLALLFRGYEDFTEQRILRERTVTRENASFKAIAEKVGWRLSQRLAQEAPGRQELDEARELIEAAVGRKSGSLAGAVASLDRFISSRIAGVDQWDRALELVTIAHQLVTYPASSMYRPAAEKRLASMVEAQEGKEASLGSR